MEDKYGENGNLMPRDVVSKEIYELCLKYAELDVTKEPIPVYPSVHFFMAALLDYLNYHDDLFDAEGKAASRIRWECSCHQKMCGACAMVIDGVPALACDVFLKEIKINGDTMTLEPLPKFPAVADLIVGRRAIFDSLVESGLWLDEREPAESSGIRAPVHRCKVLSG